MHENGTPKMYVVCKCGLRAYALATAHVKFIEIRTSKSLMGTLVSTSAKQGLCRFEG
jgi:hypothetical protein